MIRAKLRETGRECEACILDVSSRGLCATAADPPRHGSFVELMVGPNCLVGQVKWSGERRFGVQLRERISVIALVSGEGSLKPVAARGGAASLSVTRDALGARREGRWLQYGVLLAAALAAAGVLGVYANRALAHLDTVNQALSGAHRDG